MHYAYFTIEQRETLEHAMRERLAEPGMELALERLHTPEFGVCESCGADIAFAALRGNPTLKRCARCQPAP
jgi:RNA polymerase-binding transcription factor